MNLPNYPSGGSPPSSVGSETVAIGASPAAEVPQNFDSALHTILDNREQENRIPIRPGAADLAVTGLRGKVIQFLNHRLVVALASAAAVYPRRGLIKLADQVTECQVQSRIVVRPGSATPSVIAETCKLRICPYCHLVRIANWIERLKRKLGSSPEARRNLRVLTLTLRLKSGEELRQMLQILKEAFRKLRHRVIWKDNVRGAIAVTHVEYSRRRQAWNAHLHVLLDSEFIPVEAVRTAWSEVTENRGRRVHLAKAKPEIERKIAYLLSLPRVLFSPDPTLVGEYILAVYRKPLVLGYKSLKHLSERMKSGSRRHTVPNESRLAYGPVGKKGGSTGRSRKETGPSAALRTRARLLNGIDVTAEEFDRRVKAGDRAFIELEPKVRRELDLLEKRLCSVPVPKSLSRALDAAQEPLQAPQIVLEQIRTREPELLSRKGS